MTRLIMTFNEENGGTKGVKWAFGRRACQHCTDAPCAAICPSGAIYKDEETGLVPIDPTKCIGCQYCSIACPFDVPRYYESGGVESVFKRTVINKCNGCIDRVREGLSPACVTTCQPGALKFGDGTVSESDALYHWGHWARKELTEGENIVLKPKADAK